MNAEMGKYKHVTTHHSSLTVHRFPAGGLFQHPAREWIAIFKKAVLAYDHLFAGAWR